MRMKVLLPARKFWCCARLFIPYNRSSPSYKNAAGKLQIFVHRLLQTPFLCENILSSVETRYSCMDGNSILSFYLHSLLTNQPYSRVYDEPILSRERYLATVRRAIL